MMRSQFIKEYLSFSRKERGGIFLLLFFILLCIVAPFFYPFFIHSKKYDHTAFEQAIAQLKLQEIDSSMSKKYYSKNFDKGNYQDESNRDGSYYESSEKKYHAEKKAEVFYFDPNTVSANDWVRLGVRDKTIRTIQKYISKGGHFYKPGDLSKIWGLHPDDIERMLPYVKIESNQKSFAVKKNYPENQSYKKPLYQITDVNTADTSAFILLPGIGSKLANRIVNFRDKLGGFYSIEQVKETFGLPDSTFQKIRSKLMLAQPEVKKIDINSATLDELKAHPYLRYAIANAIIQYRNQHGKFSSVETLKNIMLVTPEIYSKVFPYLSAGL
ncbi:MAG: helix-hairpin-helix domain-containing protein [Chitinophagaceae bacterium]|nr:helix-hairpin-helix domain-containing protein [Chitinophagaceae bacterium]